MNETPTSDKIIRQLDLTLAGMTCAACSTRIEKVLNRLPRVEASVNLASERARTLSVGGRRRAGAIAEVIARSGFAGRIVDDSSQADEKARKLAIYQAERRRYPDHRRVDAVFVGADGDDFHWT